MLMPKRVKWRKQMRGRMKGKALRGAEVSFGEWGLQALEPRLGDCSPDRGGSPRDRARNEAPWQSLDPHIPVETVHTTAAGNPYG